MERETVVLTTMNGKQKFTWDENTLKETLEETGLGRMTAFRVTVQPKEDPEKESSAKKVEEK